MKKYILGILIVISTAAMADKKEELPITSTTTEAEPFKTVTATNGREWVQQCEMPAKKSDSNARFWACHAFFKGAMAVIANDPKKVCFAKIPAGTAGFIDASFALAKEKPLYPVGAILEITARTLAPSCK